MDNQKKDDSEDKKVPSRDTHGFTDLHIAAWTGNSKKLTNLLKKYPTVNVQDNEKRTPLHLAVVHGNREIVDALVKAGADINIKDQNENTPLFKALELDQKSIAKYLIDKGANLDITDADGNSALHKIILKGNEKFTSQAIKKTRDINIINKYGESPLHLAIIYGMADCVKQLLERGANVNCADSQNRTPFVLASSTGQTNIAHMLLKAGADPYVSQTDDLTTAAVTRTTGHDDVINATPTHAFKNKDPSSINEHKANLSTGIREDPEMLLTAKSDDKGKRSKDARPNAHGDQKAVRKVSDVMQGMNDMTNKLGSVHNEVKQWLLEEEKQLNEIQELRTRLIQIEREKNELMGSDRHYRNSMKNMESELKDTKEKVTKFVTGIERLEKKVAETTAANSELRGSVEKAVAKENDAKLALDNMEKRADQIKIDRQGAQAENHKKNDLVNSLRADIQNKEKEQSNWSRRVAAINSEISNLTLQADTLQKDLKTKEKVLEDSVRDFENKIETLTKERNSLEKSVNAEIRKRSTSDKNVAALQQEVTAASENCNAAKKEAKGLQAKLEEKSRLHCKAEKALREEVECLRTANISLSQRVNDLKVSLQRMEQELEKEHVESDRVICSLHNELQRKNAMLHGNPRSVQSEVRLYKEKAFPARA